MVPSTYLKWNLDKTNLGVTKSSVYTNSCSYPSNSKKYELKEPRYNETSSKQTYFVYPLALRSSTMQQNSKQ